MPSVLSFRIEGQGADRFREIEEFLRHCFLAVAIAEDRAFFDQLRGARLDRSGEGMGHALLLKIGKRGAPPETGRIDPGCAPSLRVVRAAERERKAAVEGERRSAAHAEEHDEMAAYLTACDNAWDKLGSFMRSGSGTPLEGYQLAAAAERICDASWSTLREVEMRDDRTVTDETIEACQISANNRTRAAKAIGAVFDGDTRPSAMTNATELVRGAEGAVTECKDRLAAQATEGAS